MPIDPNEFPPIPGEEEDFPKERRDARSRWDLERTRAVRQYDLGETDPVVAQTLDPLVQQISELWDRLDADSAKGLLLLKDDVDLVLQKIEAALAISNEPELRRMRLDFLASFPEAGTKKYE